MVWEDEALNETDKECVALIYDHVYRFDKVIYMDKKIKETKMNNQLGRIFNHVLN